MEGPRFLSYYAGSRWLVTVVVVVVMASLSLWLLDALQDAEELAERAVVETTIRNIRTGLMLATGSAAIEGREKDVRLWEGSNPLQWLAPAPPEHVEKQPTNAPWAIPNSSGVPMGYQGECAATEIAKLPGGAWCFDRDNKELVYRPRRHRYLRILGGGRNDNGGDVLRWRAVVLNHTEQQVGSFIGLRVEIVTPYAWGAE